MYQTMPDDPTQTAVMPIFEIKDDGLVIHYQPYYLAAGMERAGTPLNAEEKEMVAFIDSLARRDDLLYRYLLQPGEILFSNNRVSLHGRDEFEDHEDPDRCRLLARLWMWRRHIGPGQDPVALDAAEYGFPVD